MQSKENGKFPTKLIPLFEEVQHEVGPYKVSVVSAAFDDHDFFKRPPFSQITYDPDALESYLRLAKVSPQSPVALYFCESTIIDGQEYFASRTSPNHITSLYLPFYQHSSKLNSNRLAATLNDQIIQTFPILFLEDRISSVDLYIQELRNLWIRAIGLAAIPLIHMIDTFTNQLLLGQPSSFRNAKEMKRRQEQLATSNPIFHPNLSHPTP